MKKKIAGCYEMGLNLFKGYLRYKIVFARK